MLFKQLYLSLQRENDCTIVQFFLAMAKIGHVSFCSFGSDVNLQCNKRKTEEST